MHQIKLFVHKNDIIKLRCPSCLQKIKIPASVLKNKYKLRGKCKCQSIIEVELEHRRSFRKEKNLDGFYSYNSEKSQNVKLLDGDIETKFTSTNCKIINISTNGLGLKSLKPHEIKKDDILHVLFQLSPGTNIKKKVVIRNVQDEYIGCEFIDGQAEDKGIDFI
jgi:hypothetical protein